MKTVTDEQITTIEKAMDHLKKGWPSLRRTASTAIVRSGGTQTVFGCLCGSRHTCATDWNGRESKHVRDWQQEHADCAVRLANADLRGEEITLSFGR